MSHSSPLSIPERTPDRPEIIEFSTPWSNFLVEEFQTPIDLAPPPKWIGHYTKLNFSTSRRHTHCPTRVLWYALAIIVCFWLLLGKGSSVQLEDDGNVSESHRNLDGLKFIDATHPYLRYIGRWTSSLGETRKEGSFPGVYFDFIIDGTTTVLLSLHNTDEQSNSKDKILTETTSGHSSFQSTNVSSAGPVSLLARIDEDEYIILPNATSIVPIRMRSLDANSRHQIRVIAPMFGDGTVETLQVEGLWIDQAGELLPYKVHPEELSSQRQDGTWETQSAPKAKRRKMLEVVTDMPGSMAGLRRDVGTTRNILGGVMGWDYLLGDMFESDHVTIGDGMCLIRECIGGKGSPAGLADIYFQSGPVGSNQYNMPWLFKEDMPDVMIMNIGSSDWDSFQMHGSDYNKTAWELNVEFEETYISMIKAIRTLAYPKVFTSGIESRYIYSDGGNAPDIPIFVMRPLRGQLEQATHAVVDRLRKEGDKSVFWLDTSGWLNTEVVWDDEAEDKDFSLDGDNTSRQWRLTERGNYKIAILLHTHVCRYLARDADKCAFLPPDVYER